MTLQRADKPAQHNVLLVEDSRVHRELATAVLEKHGYRVVQAGDGQEALEQLLKDHFSLILMDIEMPYMDGVTSAEIIRTMQLRGEIAEVPVIAITADHSDSTYTRCMAAGMVDVIPKHIWKPKWEALIVERLEKLLGS